MIEGLLVVMTILLVGAVLLLLLLLFNRNKSSEGAPGQIESQFAVLKESADRSERIVREEMARNREEASLSAKQDREEIGSSLKSFADSLLSRMTEIATLQKQQLESFSQQIGALTSTNEQKMELMRSEAATTARQGREETAASLKAFGDSLLNRMMDIANLQQNQLESFSQQLAGMMQSNEQKLEKMRETVELKLHRIQEDNSAKLELMRATVDEKLHATLEQRLGESFKLVSDRLEQVHKGLGEMQLLASGVGDLKKVLTNVKTRGTWGEIQLGNLLEQVLTPEQYACNVITKPSSNDRVEYAIKLPGRDGVNGATVWLPIDAKFPQEDYQKLVEAQEAANAGLAEEAGKLLELRIKAEGKAIKEKYIDPPNTTDFGIMFLPIESLYAEVLRRPGLCETLQRECRVVVTGPTTLAALLNSLQMGFRTLAIEKRSSEVWSLLAAVKTEFGRFGEILDKTQKKLQEASNTIESAATRSRVIERKLRSVQELPAPERAGLFGAVEEVDPVGD